MFGRSTAFLLYVLGVRSLSLGRRRRRRLGEEADFGGDWAETELSADSVFIAEYQFPTCQFHDLCAIGL